MKCRKTSWTTSKTSSDIVKHHETLLKHCETSRKPSNTLHSVRRYLRSMRRHRRTAWRHRCLCGVSGNINDCGVVITPLMCNRVSIMEIWVLFPNLVSAFTISYFQLQFNAIYCCSLCESMISCSILNLLSVMVRPPEIFWFMQIWPTLY